MDGVKIIIFAPIISIIPLFMRFLFQGIQKNYVQFADFLVIDCGTSELREGEPTAPVA